MKKIFANNPIRYSLLVLGGIFIGWLLFHSSNAPTPTHEHAHEHEAAQSTIWTCSMHPQIRKDKPGKCPICAMELIPLNQGGNVSVDPAAIQFTKEAAELANVQTTMVTRQKPIKEVRLYGKVQADERLLQSQVAHIPGRIEKLLVNFTGETVRKGQPLALIYSPDLVTAQQELLEAANTKQSQPEIYEAAKGKLRQWKLTEQQIAQVEKSGTVQTNFELVSNTSGIVTARKVNNGDYISKGSALFDIADLSSVWALFDAYESDLPFLSQGDKITFTVQAIPGKLFTGTITFIDPVIDPTNRVAKVRVEVGNRDGILKPEMFITGMAAANLAQYKDKMIIPRSAVLWTGKRSIVYVKLANSNEPIFKVREIVLGPALGNSYIVESGLKEGEALVTQGAFSVDAAAQLEGKPSMMNTEGTQVSTSSMPGMDMGNGSDKVDKHASNTPGSESKHIALEHKMIKVFGNCDMCKERIESTAKLVKGVASAEWNAENQMLHVQFDPTKTSVTAIQKALAKVGHDTEKFKASSAVYNSLPECCWYRK